MRAAIAWPSSLPKKYSVNPNGGLRSADSRRVGRREHRMPVELVETKLQGALPVHLVARDGLEAVGLAPSAVAWAKANGFSGEAGRTL
ncbi:leucyl aminopeptidase family protein, partial [Mesorhizobium sp. BHbdii]